MENIEEPVAAANTDGAKNASTKSASAQTGEAERKTVLHERPYRLHDFRRPHLLAEGELRALESFFGKFARSASAALSSLARARVQVDLTSIAQKSYFELIRSLPNPTGLYLVYHLPERLPFVLEIGPTALYPLIERLLGGKGECTAPPNRPPTRIEQALGKTVAAQILRALESTWSATSGVQESSSTLQAAPEVEAAPTRLDLAESEHNPLLMQIVGPSEPTLALSFQAAMGFAGALSGQFHLCLPIKPFEPLLSRLVRATSPGLRPREPSQAERDRILTEVSTTPLELKAELANLRVDLSDILALRPGDVLDLAISREAEAAIYLDGRRTLQGQPVIHQGHRALRIAPSAAEDSCPIGPGKN